MNSYIAQFPLKITVFPGELVHLHIFEERYKELINDCMVKGAPFGIPTIIKSQGLLSGTTIRDIKVKRIYPDGKLDISVVGGEVYDIIRFDDPMSSKRYSGAEVSIREFDPWMDPTLNPKIIELVIGLYRLMSIAPYQELEASNLAIPSFVHKIGLTINQEFQLLQLPSAVEQQEFIIDHLEALLPVVKEMETMRKRIQMNGHFKGTSSLNLD